MPEPNGNNSIFIRQSAGKESKFVMLEYDSPSTTVASFLRRDGNGCGDERSNQPR